MPKPVDLSKSLAALDQDSTLIVVIELSQSSWLVAARAGLARDPLKKRAPDPEQLFKLIDRWREESRKAGRVVRRVCVAFEAGRDGFWLARLLRQHHIEADHSPDEHPGEAGLSPRQDGSARYGAADAGVPGLAARRGRPLQHGGDPDAGGGSRQTPPRGALASRASRAFSICLI